MTSLNPSFTIGDQIIETILRHRGGTRNAARARAIELLRRVHIPSPERRIDEYPHKLSGGMRQRVMIAMALACDPPSPDRRRTHDRARRHLAGPDPRSDARTEGGERRRDHPHHPRSRRGRRGLRRGRGDVLPARSSSAQLWMHCSQRRNIPTLSDCSARFRGWIGAAPILRPSKAWFPTWPLHRKAAASRRDVHSPTRLVALRLHRLPR